MPTIFPVIKLAKVDLDNLDHVLRSLKQGPKFISLRKDKQTKDKQKFWKSCEKKIVSSLMQLNQTSQPFLHIPWGQII